jgi:hypothetical protein
MPTYIACLLELHMKSQLFFTAHQLADEAPGKPTVYVTPFTVTALNLLIKRLYNFMLLD